MCKSFSIQSDFQEGKVGHEQNANSLHAHLLCAHQQILPRLAEQDTVLVAVVAAAEGALTLEGLTYSGNELSFSTRNGLS